LAALTGNPWPDAFIAATLTHLESQFGAPFCNTPAKSQQ
jgi:hypothetical protein